MENGVFGKKVFFLYPPAVLSEVVEGLANLEFEVYLVRDHVKLKKAIPSFPDAILFANLDEGLKDGEWRAYIRSIMEEAPEVGVGLITLNDNSSLREYYLMTAQVRCGFVILNIGAARTSEILAKTLEANEARGRRKFVRALCAPGMGKLSAGYEGVTLRAEVTDLSSVGMAIRLEGGVMIPVGTVLRDITLTIKGQRILVSGVVVAMHGEDLGRVHVLMFDPASIDEARRSKLKTLVFRINQAAMDLLLDHS
jgi:hypothetical protein